MRQVITSSTRVAMASVVLLVLMLVGCGGSSNSGGCPKSSREKPLSNLDPISCQNWDLSISTASLVPNGVILQANQFNDVSDFKSWIVVEATLRYKGSETGEISDAISPTIMLGSKNAIYVANDEKPTFSKLEDEFAPIPYKASNPYSGGSVSVSLWFWVDSDDSNFVLGFFVGDRDGDEPNVWIDVAGEPEADIYQDVPVEAVTEETEAFAILDPCDPAQYFFNGKYVFNYDLSNCDFSNQVLDIVTFEGRILRGANFVGADISGASFENSDLSNANFTGANLVGTFLNFADLTGANLDGANLSGAFLGDVILSRASLINANLSDAIFNRENVSCRVSGGSNTCGWGDSVVGANLSGANLSGADFSRADLTGANLNYANLTGTIFNGTTMPDGKVKN